MTLRQLRAHYTRLKRKFWAGDDLPNAAEIKFVWAEPGERSLRIDCTDELAMAVWDTETPVDGRYHYRIALNPDYKGVYIFTILALLHEMVHLAKPKADHGPEFKAEVARIGDLGALHELLQ